ncbi:MAG TPA: hypothetical protein VJM51_05235, partial [Dehalococcoidia bacterium]|nr:hypothetical protein [Dehalococcoidia bacterium]
PPVGEPLPIVELPAVSKVVDRSVNVGVDGGNVVAGAVETYFPAGAFATAVKATVRGCDVTPGSGRATCPAQGDFRAMAKGLLAFLGLRRGQAPEILPPPPEGFAFGTLVWATSAVNLDTGQLVSSLDLAASLTVSYNTGDLVLSGGSPESRLKLARLDSEEQRWETLATSADRIRKTLRAEVSRLGIYALLAEIPSPNLVTPADQQLVGLGPLLTWEQASRVTQYHLTVVPAPNQYTGAPDGPGIDLVIGDRALVAQKAYLVKAPQRGEGNYVMLPGMSYQWCVSVTFAPFSLGSADPGWSTLSCREFRTLPAASSTIAPTAPVHNSKTSSTQPTLTWKDMNLGTFYYEVQLSADPSFSNADHEKVVYFSLVHGGFSSPENSWQSPPLEPGAVYYWRVRPRVQGDGFPVPWSDTWSFRTGG